MSISILAPIGDLLPGMVLAEPVYHPTSFQQLLGPGTVLDQTNIYLLVRCGVASVPVFTFQAPETSVEHVELDADPKPRRALTGPLGNPFKSGPAVPAASAPPRPRNPACLARSMACWGAISVSTLASAMYPSRAIYSSMLSGLITPQFRSATRTCFP